MRMSIFHPETLLRKTFVWFNPTDKATRHALVHKQKSCYALYSYQPKVSNFENVINMLRNVFPKRCNPYRGISLSPTIRGVPSSWNASRPGHKRRNGLFGSSPFVYQVRKRFVVRPRPRVVGGGEGRPGTRAVSALRGHGGGPAKKHPENRRFFGHQVHTGDPSQGESRAGRQIGINRGWFGLGSRGNRFQNLFPTSPATIER